MSQKKKSIHATKKSFARLLLTTGGQAIMLKIKLCPICFMLR
ncbi:hypothetical protein BVRB_4g078060 [Beta vulgaris subsp. vulgaris]|nr:hypothetical protein BVRB_4g078060 [Beta vulgaris subsp. vulgaris]